MKYLLDLIELWWLKRQATALVYRIDRMWMDYDCGRDLIDHITGGRLTRYELELNQLMSRIREIGNGRR